MSENELRVRGWHRDEATGGSRYWDGSHWTGDFRPPRKPFAAASAHKGWGIGLTVAGALFVVSSPGQFAQPPEDASAPPVVYFLFGILLGLGLLALGVYLLRGQGPTTKAVESRLAEAQARRSMPPPPRPSAATSHTINVNVTGGADASAAAAAQVQAIANPETAKALQNLQNLLYTKTITDAEYQAAKDKLLGQL